MDVGFLLNVMLLRQVIYMTPHSLADAPFENYKRRL